MNQSSLSELNHFKWDDTSNNKSPIYKGGMTCYYLAHLGQSSQDSKKYLKKCRVTRGRYPSPLLGALNANLSKRLRTIKHFLAVPQTLATRGSDKYPQNPSHRITPSQSFNLWKLLTSWVDLKNPRGFSLVKKTPLQQTDNKVYFPNKLQIPRPEFASPTTTNQRTITPLPQ